MGGPEKQSGRAASLDGLGPESEPGSCNLGRRPPRPLRRAGHSRGLVLNSNKGSSFDFRKIDTLAA